MRNISFDIFDTVITRTVAHPKAAFIILQNEVIQSDIQIPVELSVNFSQERISSERQARKTSKNEDVKIKEIYEIIRKKFNLLEDIVELLIATEVRVESDVIRVIPETAQFITDLRRQDKRIIYISDMYLPTDVIRNILVEKGLFREGDGLYISGHVGLRKKTGRLFRHVLHLEGLQPSQIMHVGDNRLNDYIMARLNGIKALHLKHGRLNRYEKILTDCPKIDPAWMTCQLLSGAGRLARLGAYRQADIRLRALHEIGANVVGPVLFLFVYWLLHEAKKDNIKTLYFLARDGQIMMQVASLIAEKLGFSIELKYLYVSRQSLFAPSFLDLSELEIDWILQKDPELTIALVAKRLSVDEIDFQCRIVDAGFPQTGLHSDISPPLRKKLRQILLENSCLRAYLASKSAELREKVVGYLRQQGLCDSKNWAFVDSGWNGRLQNAMQIILSNSGHPCQTRGYYFGLFDLYSLRGTKKGFLFSEKHPGYIRWCRPFTFIFEMMTSAPHATTQAYEKSTSGEYQPVIDNAKSGVDPCEIKALRDGTFDYVNELELDRICYDEGLYRKKAFCLLKRFYLKPSKSEAEAFGKLKYSNDQTDSSLFGLAQVMSFTDCCKFTFKMLGQTKYAKTYWLNGSRARSSVFVKPFLYALGLIHFTLNSIYVKYLCVKVQLKR